MLPGRPDCGHDQSLRISFMQTSPGYFEEPFSRKGVSASTQQELHGLPGSIHRSIDVGPRTFHPEARNPYASGCLSA